MAMQVIKSCVFVEVLDNSEVTPDEVDQAMRVGLILEHPLSRRVGVRNYNQILYVLKILFLMFRSNNHQTPYITEMTVPRWWWLVQVEEAQMPLTMKKCLQKLAPWQGLHRRNIPLTSIR